MKEGIARRQGELDFLNDPEAYGKNEEYKAMAIACDAIILQAERHAVACRRLAGEDR